MPPAMNIEPTPVVYKRVMFDAKDEAWDREMVQACQKMEVALKVRNKWIPVEVSHRNLTMPRFPPEASIYTRRMTRT